MKTQIMMIAVLCGFIFYSCNQTEQKINSTVKENQKEEKSIDYQIMVQRATQAAIWAMPGVALVDFLDPPHPGAPDSVLPVAQSWPGHG